MRRRRQLLWTLAGVAALGLARLPLRGEMPPGSGPADTAGDTTDPARPPEDVCIVAPPQPYPASAGLAARALPEQARCPVCGMFPARHPEWAAQVVFDNGDTQFLDSPLSLFLYLGRVARYTPGRSAAQIAAIHVRDLLSGEWLALEQAVFVQGSSARGPMRSGNLPAFASAAAAQRFIAQRGGEPRSAAQLRRALPPELLRQAPHRHQG